LTNYDSAFYYYHKAIYIKPSSLHEIVLQNAAINNIGNVHRRMENYDSASYYYDIAISRSKLLELRNLEAVVLKNYGIVYTKLGDFKAAQDAFEQSLSISNKIKLKRIIQLNYALLSNLFEQKNDYKNALLYYKMFSHVRDSIYSQEHINMIRHYETEFDYEVAAKENALELKNTAEKNLSIKKHENLITIYLASIICLVIFIVFMLYLFRTNKRAKDNFKNLNKILEEKVKVRTKHLDKEIEEHKLTTKKLIKSKEKAEESDRLKSAFLANMSHEIRTPMNGILGFTNLLLEPDLSSENSVKYIGIINKSGHRMLNTINDIIDIAKIDSQQMQLTKGVVNITKLMSELFSFFEVNCKEKGIKLILNNFKESRDIVIKTDKTKFNSIMINLINNAIKYTDKGAITIDCIKDEKELKFSIKDTGIGIPLNRQSAIFNRFEQADVSDKRAQQGSGLGLAITKSYIEMLDGEISLESVEDLGSTFYFTLPLNNTEIQSENAIESEQKSEPTDKEKVITPTKKIKILIAEDDETSSVLLLSILKKTNCEIIRSFNGAETVELCRKNPDIDIIVMDVRMPEINGYIATKKIREFNKNVFIIASEK